MTNTTTQLSTAREHTGRLLRSIGVSRIVVVDDEYRRGDVEELIGLCAVLPADQAGELPLLHGIDFRADYDIWSGRLREKWPKLDEDGQDTVLKSARAMEAEMPRTEDGGDVIGTANGRVDTEASGTVDAILSGLEGCELVRLSLSQWRVQKDDILGDDRAQATVFLFDRDFTREGGTDSEGIELIRYVQNARVGYCGMLSHTVPREGEHTVWRELTEEYGLARNTFVVIAKERLTGEPKDYWAFLRMLRFVGLSGRYAKVLSGTWAVLEESMAKAKTAVEWLPLSDFDTIVFGSSRREGVWEPDTLLRVFGILMRQDVQRRLRQDAKLAADVSEARRISTLSEALADALGAEEVSEEAKRMQRREMYEAANDVNRCHIPLGNGDIFRADGSEKQYVLLEQPCDLMVRPNGKRIYDWKCGRTGTFVQIVVDVKKRKESWEELRLYEVEAGKRTFVDFARVHQVLLAVLDLCVFQEDGMARIEAEVACPELVIQPWKKRHSRLAKLFGRAMARYDRLADGGVEPELKALGLPRLSPTLGIQADAQDGAVDYGIARVGRVRQPWSEALLTGLTQRRARAAFEHDFDKRPTTIGRA